LQAQKQLISSMALQRVVKPARPGQRRVQNQVLPQRRWFLLDKPDRNRIPVIFTLAGFDAGYDREYQVSTTATSFSSGLFANNSLNLAATSKAPNARQPVIQIRTRALYCWPLRSCCCNCSRSCRDLIFLFGMLTVTFEYIFDFTCT